MISTRRTATCALAMALAFVAPTSTADAAECASGLTTELIPLPVYSTLPNEGNTWGAMPVFLRICPTDQRTESIIAPSVTWNSVIRYTGTFRWYHYPTDETTLTLIASASTYVNFNFLLAWQRLPTATGLSTDEATLRLQRSVFFRFFGLGPDTPPEAQTSYTGLRAFATGRRGINVAPHLNVGASVGAERDGVESTGVPGLPLSPTVFPTVPGMRGATLLSQGVDLRYDHRHGGDYAERGVRVEASFGVVEGLDNSPTFVRGGVQARGLFPEVDGITGAARLYWHAVSSGNAPFYQQSSLGGSYLLRGFMEDRFIDRQAWTVEMEQRIRLFETHLFGVVTDWRMDPFVAAGQVFGPFNEAFSRPRFSTGVGFRAFVHPNIVGRVDVAYGGEGLNVYVELGYPY